METSPQIRERAQYLTFWVADEEYAIGVLRVREIVTFGTVRRVPRTPPWIRGVVSLRTQVVPVVDLAAKLGLPATTPARDTCIIVVEAELGSERVVMGVVADRVSQVIDLGRGEIIPPPPFGSRIRVEYLIGLAKTDQRITLLLDIDKVLSADEILAIADAAATTDGATPPESTAIAAPRASTI
jgi:purine-binding chemotaxis protein CheW